MGVIIILNSNDYIIRLDNIKSKYNLKSDIYAKLEMYTLTRSIKDKVANSLIGSINKSDLETKKIVEVSSGNLAISLAFYLGRLNKDLTLILPKKTSPKKLEKLKNLGCKLILIDGEIKECITYAKRLEKMGYLYLNQFENEFSYKAHKITSDEINNYFKSKNVDIFLSVGTSSTLTGLYKYLPSNYHLIKVGLNGKNKHIEGVYANVVGSYYSNKYIYDEIKVDENEVLALKDEVVKLEKLNLGYSSLLNLYGAIKYNSSNTSLVICSDEGVNYEV